MSTPNLLTTNILYQRLLRGRGPRTPSLFGSVSLVLPHAPASVAPADGAWRATRAERLTRAAWRLGAPGIATGSKDATRLMLSVLSFVPHEAWIEDKV